MVILTTVTLSSPVNWCGSEGGFLLCRTDGEALLGVDDLDGLREDSTFSSNALPGFIPGRVASNSGGTPSAPGMSPLASSVAISKK